MGAKCYCWKHRWRLCWIWPGDFQENVVCLLQATFSTSQSFVTVAYKYSQLLAYTMGNIIHLIWGPSVRYLLRSLFISIVPPDGALTLARPLAQLKVPDFLGIPIISFLWCVVHGWYIRKGELGSTKENSRLLRLTVHCKVIVHSFLFCFLRWVPCSQMRIISFWNETF